MKKLTDLIDVDELEKLFKGTNFGETINSNRDMKLSYALKALEERLYGYHTGYTITQIMTKMKWLTPKQYKITRKGMDVLRANRRESNEKTN